MLKRIKNKMTLILIQDKENEVYYKRQWIVHLKTLRSGRTLYK